MASLIDIATLLGISTVIVLSFESLVHTRREAVRASLDQLDPIGLGDNRDLKVRAILYQCRGVVFFGSCAVKFKLYRIDENGCSDPSVFVEFPDSVFGEQEWQADGDGYIVTFDSNNPVEIRRQANEIMLAMYTHETEHAA